MLCLWTKTKVHLILPYLECTGRQEAVEGAGSGGGQSGAEHCKLSEEVNAGQTNSTYLSLKMFPPLLMREHSYLWLSSQPILKPKNLFRGKEI